MSGDDAIRDCIERGLRIEGGVLILPSGLQHRGAFHS